MLYIFCWKMNDVQDLTLIRDSLIHIFIFWLLFKSWQAIWWKGLESSVQSLREMVFTNDVQNGLLAPSIFAVDMKNYMIEDVDEDTEVPCAICADA
ncbi:uncharacterized protein LOC126801239 isoform X2 [Argentina anserina]|uniref:uncharacterized protein LOC126801239 isoform X2 n=1 Tax=Argentina anserina TaxID=57926 RepID=UPI002176900D|nr:uncharacterized protein LOC126801239 isoform X2 [Potentilla anserina]